MFEELKKYDALVFVHPDFCSPRDVSATNPFYEACIDAATEFMEEQGKPVFALYAHANVQHIPYRLQQRWISLGHAWEYTQAHVDRIAQTLGKNPDTIDIAAGGISGGKCVPDALEQWCQVIGKPFRSGKMISPFTDLG